MEKEVVEIILSLLFIIGGARLFGLLFERVLKQTAVLGELLFGILIAIILTIVDPGVLGIEHPYSKLGLEYAKHNLEPLLCWLAPFGAIILLFKVGMESDFIELRRAGFHSSLVALIGVAMPFLGGYFLLKDIFHFSQAIAIFAGATLTATSVGITARILSDYGRINKPEGRIILGAAVIDDVLGLIILSLTLGIVGESGNGFWDIGKTCLGIFIFLAATIAFGIKAVPYFLSTLKKLDCENSLFIAIACSVLGISLIAHLIGLAAIVGAFFVGLFLEDREVKEKILPGTKLLYSLFVPFFFVHAGTLFEITALTWSSLALIGTILGIALVGKFASALGAIGSGASKLAVGVGMIPRGEVGLIFISYGLHYQIIDNHLYGVLLAVVILTTVITPPLLELVLKKIVLKNSPLD